MKAKARNVLLLLLVIFLLAMSFGKIRNKCFEIIVAFHDRHASPIWVEPEIMQADWDAMKQRARARPNVETVH